MNTDEQLKTVKRDARALLRPLEALSKLRASSASFVDDLTKALKKLPVPDAFADAVEELRGHAGDLLEAERRLRTEQFGRVEAAYIARVREEGKKLREFSSSWRIGPIELELNREQSKARVLYNKEEVIGWKPVAAAEDLEDLEAKARAQLEKQALSEDELVGVVAAAFRRGRAERRSAPNPDLVPIHDLLREIRLELARRELSGSKPGRRLKTADFPMWALLYNLDCYRTISGRSGDGGLVGFQTGSMQEQQKGLGALLNGLDAVQDYRVFCYAIPRN